VRSHLDSIANPHSVTAAQAGAIPSDDVPQILVGAAASLASGNPTPSTVAFPPANYPLGSLFYATSYPAAQDNGTGQVTTYHAGDMVFRRTGGAGAEVWTWFGGSFRASNSNGNYVRYANKRQECDFTVQAAHTSSTGLVGTWTYPATFNAAPRLPAPNIDSVTGFSQVDVGYTRVDLITATSARAVVQDEDAGFVAGDTADCHMLAVGNWAA
jgi:hypothetical protein